MGKAIEFTDDNFQQEVLSSDIPVVVDFTAVWCGPCIATFPLDTETLVDLSVKYGFALEVNNTNLRLNKTDVNRLKDMIDLALAKGAPISEDSDGHTLDEIGENEQITKLLKTMGLNGDDVFFNRDDELLDQFLEKRNKIRDCRYPAA